MKIKTLFSLFTVIEILLISLIGLIHQQNIQIADRLSAVEKERYKMNRVAQGLQQSSDDLTRMARTYVVTGDERYKNDYYRVLDIRNGNVPRPKNYEDIYWDYMEPLRSTLHPDGKPLPLEKIIEHLPFSSVERQKLHLSHLNSDELVKLEEKAFSLMAGRTKDLYGSYTKAAKRDQQAAIALLHSGEYHMAKQKIMQPIDEFMLMLDNRTGDQVREAQKSLRHNEMLLGYIIGLFIAVNLLIIIILHKRIIRIISYMTNKIRQSRDHTLHFDLSKTCCKDEFKTMMDEFNAMQSIIDERTHLLQKAYEKLECVNRSLDEAQHIAKVGSWTLDMKTNELTWSAEIYRIFEKDASQIEPTYEGFLDAIHPEDVASVKHAFETALQTKQPYHITHRLKMHDGRIKYVLENGTAKYEGDTPVFVNGTVQDITERKKLEYLQERYAELIDRYVIVSSTDVNGNITSVSQAFCEISGYTKEELLGEKHSLVRHPDTDKALFTELWDAITHNIPWEGEMKNLRKDGTSYWVYATISPLWDENGHKVGYTAIRQDISDKKHVEELAVTDRLTGLYNRMKLDEVIEYEVHQAHRYTGGLSVIMMDMDKFKSVNDTYGHQAGDKVLQELATIFTRNIRESDTVGRWGGEEFLVICPETDLHHAGLMAEKLRTAVEEHDFSKVGHKSCSFGVSTYRTDDSPESIVERADKALYEAKERGRNRVVVSLGDEASGRSRERVVMDTESISS